MAMVYPQFGLIVRKEMVRRWFTVKHHAVIGVSTMTLILSSMVVTMMTHMPQHLTQLTLKLSSLGGPSLQLLLLLRQRQSPWQKMKA